MAIHLSRRAVISLLGAGLVATAARGQRRRGSRLLAFVGSWTQGPFGVGGGGGLQVFSVDETDGRMTRLSHTGQEFDNMNAGFLCVSPDGSHLYATNEVKDLGGEPGAGGGVLSFAIDAQSGVLQHVGTQPSMGVNPAYICVDASGSVVLAANHGNYDPAVTVVIQDGKPRIEKVFDDGTAALFPIRADGTLGPASDVAVLPWARGVDPIAQRSPHAHSINVDPSNRMVIVCDKGADRIFTYRLDLAAGKLLDGHVLATEAGISPRHSAFHPSEPYVFVINERQSSLSSFRYDASTGEIEQIDTAASIPDNFVERNAPADIHVHPNGQFVYGSNRGHDSIAVFAIDQGSGRLSRQSIAKTGGASPRGFNIDPSGRLLFVGNQNSDTIVVFSVNPSDGALAPTGSQTNCLKPVCIKFAYF